MPFYPQNGADLQILAKKKPSDVPFTHGVWIGVNDVPLCYINAETIKGHMTTGFSRVTAHDKTRSYEQLLWTGVGMVKLQKPGEAGKKGQGEECQSGEHQFGWCGPRCRCCAVQRKDKEIRYPPREPDWGDSCQRETKGSMCTEIRGFDVKPRTIGQFIGSEGSPFEIVLDPVGFEATRILNTTTIVKNENGFPTLGDHEIRYSMVTEKGAWRPEVNCQKGTIPIGATADGAVICLTLN
ncbi:hypothetical protein XA68_12134 [Ophiocordyceps unilateralis]|uniref:Uncharacterized protein n=1 Tax=Ophiocordyceps unilateralis TaxID=268505 RepID=A0A2A9P201_OPHUN|nr:hypothetical protein XA68_12134 [Ophiocordyceps unilateralis]